MSELMGFTTGPTILAESVAYNSGWFCGAIVIPLLLITGAAKCIQIAGRPTTSSLCAWALALPLIAWTFSSVANTAGELVENQVLSGTIFICGGLVSLLMLGTSLVLAIVGLANYKGYTQGRAQAIWAIVLSSFFIVVGVVVSAIGLAELIEEVEASDGQPVTRLDLPEAGLEMELDGTGWTQWLEMEDEYAEASVSATLDYDLTLSVIALPMDGVRATDRELYDTMLETFGYGVDDPELTGRAPASVGDAQGFRFTGDYDTDFGPMRCALYAVRTPGWAYFIAGWAEHDRGDLIDRFDRIVRQARIDADASPAPLPKQAEAHADLYNDLGLTAYNAGDYERALLGFAKARSLHASYETYTDNLIDTYEELERYSQAIELGQEHLQRFTDHHEVRANLAFQQTYLEANDAAIENYHRSFEAGFTSDYYLLDYVRTLRNVGQPERALEVLESFTINRGEANLIIERCRALSDLERHDEAIELLAPHGDRALPDPLLLAEWVRAHLRADRARAAVELGKQLTEAHPDLAEVWYARGLAETRLEWYPQARTSLQRATELGDEFHYRDQLDYVGELLGRGDNTLVRREVEPVALPAALNAGFGVSPHPAADQHASHVRRNVRAFYFEPGRPLRTTRYHTVTITGAEDLERWSTLELGFDSQYERVFVNELTVSDAQGTVVSRGDLDTYFVIDEQQDGINSDDKTLTIPVPGLAVGHTLDYTVSYETLGRPDAFPWRQRVLVSSYPTDQITVALIGAIDQVSVETTPGIEVQDFEDTRQSGHDARVWTVRPTNLYRWEPWMPAIETLYPTLSLGPAETTWEGVGRSYLSDLDDSLRMPEAFKTQAADILGDAQTPREVIRVATEHVQRNLTYEAIEFGVRGTIPHTLAQITAQRLGDCKDHSLLLLQLLRAGGVDAHLATVHTEDPLVEGIASLSQFNHMVVYVPDIDGGLVIDATDKSHAALRGTPVGVHGRTLLVLDPDRPRLVDAPPLAESNTFRSHRTITVTDTGDAEVEEVLTATGPWGEGLLEYLRGSTPEEQLGDLQRSLDVEDGIRLTAATTSDLDDLDIPLQVTVRYTVPGAFSRQDDGWFGRLPAPWEVYYLAPTFLPHRENDFERLVATRFDSTAEVKLPAGYTLSPPAPTASTADGIVDAHTRAKPTPDGMTLTSHITVHAGRHPPDRYAEYQNALDRALRALRPALRLNPS